MNEFIKPIVLIGFKSVGKSVIGKNFAKKYAVPFIDLDEKIESLYQAHYAKKKACREIMLHLGEQKFREIETQALSEVVHISPSVIAAGGGALIQKNNQTMLQGCRIIHIIAPKKSVFERISHGERPAFFNTEEDLFIAFNKLWKKRNKTYAKIRNFSIMNDASVDNAADQLMRCINTTKLNIVMGYPLQHTQSPLLHNTVYHLLQCNYVLLAHETNDLLSTMQAIKTGLIALVAVTMPYKKQIIPYLDEVSAAAKQLQAVNTVINRDGRLLGYNTDIDGIAYALRSVSLHNKNVLILGAGGAAHAIAYYLKKNQAHLLWLNRTQEHVLTAITLFGGDKVDEQQLNMLPIDIIINTTPLGMFPDIHSSPLPHYHFKPDQIVFDLIYNPMETTLMKNAKSQGAVCISGLDMFIGQGLKQIELLLNKAIITPEFIHTIKQQCWKK